MTSYVLRRLAQMLPVLLIASFAIFAMIYAVPGGPVAIIVGENASAEEIAEVTRKFGFDRPMIVQYFDWLSRAITGDFGLSLHSRQPVLHLIGERLPATLQLALCAILVALAIGIPVAVASAIKPQSWFDRLLSGWSALALGVPTFWLGILLILLFAVELRLLPSASRYVPLWELPVDALRSLILPAMTLGVYVSGVLGRFLRASLIGEARADYVRTARAKGVPENRVVGLHIMRNALLPFVTIVGLMMANFIGGAVVTEAVFTYPGLGRLLIQAITTRDYPLLQGCILVILVAYMLINLTVDMLYAWIDPRIEYR
ncbi:Peptide ABC transporter permease OS=Bosea thiooxidans OX=53254 GN=ARD30_11475 PE=3 SV=1 [Bosea thiooxidans]